MTITSHSAQLLVDYINKLREELPAGVEPLNSIPSINIQDLVQTLADLERVAHYKD